MNFQDLHIQLIQLDLDAQPQSYHESLVAHGNQQLEGMLPSTT